MKMPRDVTWKVGRFIVETCQYGDLSNRIPLEALYNTFKLWDLLVGWKSIIMNDRVKYNGDGEYELSIRDFKRGLKLFCEKHEFSYKVSRDIYDVKCVSGFQLTQKGYYLLCMQRSEGEPLYYLDLASDYLQHVQDGVKRYSQTALDISSDWQMKRNNDEDAETFAYWKKIQDLRKNI
jgi:hypothetical protein